MEALTCETCRHFRQHYVKVHEGYAVTGYGHCVYPRLKSRRTASPACENFLPAEEIHSFPAAAQTRPAE